MSVPQVPLTDETSNRSFRGPIRICTRASCSLYAVSFALPALRMGQSQVDYGYQAFIAGLFAPHIWAANPAYWISLGFALAARPFGMAAWSTTATFFGLLALGRHERNAGSLVVQDFLLGYWLWILSFLVLVVVGWTAWFETAGIRK